MKMKNVKLLSSGSLRHYSMELLVVVLGITISVSIDRHIREVDSVKQSVQVLHLLKDSLQDDLADIALNLTFHNKALKIAEANRARISEPGTLRLHLRESDGNVIAFSTFASNPEARSILNVKGYDLLKSKDLLNRVQTLYNVDYKAIEQRQQVALRLLPQIFGMEMVEYCEFDLGSATLTLVVDNAVNRRKLLMALSQAMFLHSGAVNNFERTNKTIHELLTTIDAVVSELE